MAAFRANGLITLTTDFGAREPFVGIMKGVMLGHAPHLRFIDMAHEVSAFQPVEAGFWLAHALRYFPAGTLHVAVVDPGVGTPRALLVAFSGDQALLAPDNGLLAPLAARGKIDRVIQRRQRAPGQIRRQRRERHLPWPRRVRAAGGGASPRAAATPADLGPEVTAINQTGWPATTPRADGGVDGVIVAVDRFGNLISNIESSAVVALADADGASSGACDCRCNAPTATPARANTWGSSTPSTCWRSPDARGNAAAGLEPGRGGAHFGRSGGSGPPNSGAVDNRTRIGYSSQPHCAARLGSQLTVSYRFF